jgi:hypothetical protein
MRDMDDLFKCSMSATRVPGLGISFTIISRKANNTNLQWLLFLSRSSSQEQALQS